MDASLVPRLSGLAEMQPYSRCPGDSAVTCAPGRRPRVGLRRTVITYQVVAGLPTGISQPCLVFPASITRPTFLPALFSGTASTDFADLRFRRIICPFTGSITAGLSPQSKRDVLFSFHFIRVFAERAVATRR